MPPVALTLSEAFCVDRYRDEFIELMRKGTVDLVFANEAELHSLYQTSDFDSALKALREGVPPRELRNIAPPELMRRVTRTDDFERWTKDFLGGA